MGEEYFTPIYAPEFRSKISHTLLRKVREKLVAPEFPAKDPYAFILNELNEGNADHAYPSEISIHIARIMEEIHLATAPAEKEIPSAAAPVPEPQ